MFQEIVFKARKQQLCLETIDVSLLLQEVFNYNNNTRMKSGYPGVFHLDEASSETGCILSLPGDCSGRSGGAISVTF